MAVDIDSLQIEIEATSSDAASKIEQLATALTNLKSAAKGGAGLTTTTKQLQALSNAAKLINGTNLDSQKIQQFASAMNSLSTIQKASGLNSTINALKKLPEISTALDKADLGKFSQQMNQVASAMRPLATEMQKVANGFSAFPIRIQKIIQSNSALTASNNKTAKSFGVLGTGISSAQAKFGVYLIAFRQIASVMSNWVKESNDYVENLNLFTVAMGDYAEEAKAYAEEIQAAMGIDPSEWMRNQGVFMQMASGFGVATDSAALMSKNLTQLGYDISSFYNIGIEEAMEKLQSGLAGEIEPLRRLGYAIDVASLEQIALNHGITESINAMTQAEKAQLRYVAIMEQSTNALNDMARTVQTPANSLRILNQQITQLSRALGNLLIPLLQQIIPWVQAFVEVITEAIQALAVLFGFELPTIDYSGLDGVSVGASEAEDAIGGATDAAKKMKRELLGIDELNIIEPNNNASGAGGVGSVSGGDLGLELPEYDFLNGLSSQTDELKEKMKELLYDYVLPIGAALAAWKILDLLSNLGAATAMIANLKKALLGGVVAYLEFRLVKGAFDDFLSDDGTIWDFVKGALYTALGTGILYMLFGTAGIVVGLGVSLVATLVSLGTAIGNGLDYNGFKANLMTVFASALGGGIGFVLGGPVGAAIGILVAGALTLNLTSIMAHISGQVERGSSESIIAMIQAALATGLAGAGIGFTIGGPLGAAVGFVIGASLSIVGQNIAIDFGNWYQETSRIVDGIEVLDDTISETTKNAVEPFLTQMRELDDTFASLEFTGTIIDDSVILDVQAKMGEIVNTITSALDSNQNEALQTLNPLANFMDESTYAEILAQNAEYYAAAKSQIQASEQEIMSIMQTSLDEEGRITQEGWQRISEIQAKMQNLGVSNLSETQVEYETIMRNLKDNAAHISLEQASEIIKNAQTTRDETIAAAETQYSTVLLEAQKMLDTGAINSEQYQAIIDAAKEAKDSTVADAREQFSSIYNVASEKLGDLAKYIDQNTGEIKSKWQVFCDDISAWWSETASGLGETLRNIGQAFVDAGTWIAETWNSMWTDMGNTLVSAINGIISAVETGLNWVIKKLNSFSFTVPDWIPVIGGNSFGFDIPEITLGRVDYFASGGFPDYGEMFIAREDGPELVGRIGNRTAVANNDQIVEGIASANDGVINAIYAMAQRIVTAIEENGGDIYVEADGTATQNRRNRMYGKTLQYI